RREEIEDARVEGRLGERGGEHLLGKVGGALVGGGLERDVLAGGEVIEDDGELGRLERGQAARRHELERRRTGEDLADGVAKRAGIEGAGLERHRGYSSSTSTLCSAMTFSARWLGSSS